MPCFPASAFFSRSVYLVGCDVPFVVRLWFYVNEEELDPAGMASEVIVRSYALGSLVLCFPSLSLPSWPSSQLSERGYCPPSWLVL